MKAVQFTFLLLLSFSSLAQLEKSSYYARQSHILFDEDRLKEAERYADSALFMAIRSGIPDSLANAYRWMYEIHLAKKEYQKSLMDFRMATVYHDSVLRLQEVIAAGRRDSVHNRELQSFDERTSILNLEIQELKQMADADRRNAITIFFAMLAFVIIVLYFFYRRNSQILSELEMSRAELASRDAFKTKLFSVLSKDVENALKVFETLVSKLAEDLSRERLEDRMAQLNTLQQHAHSLHEILNHVTQWVSYQVNEKSFEPSEFDCKELADEVLGRFQSHLNGKGITADCFVPEGQVAYADKSMIIIVLENLIANAIHFTEPGGRITLFSGKNDDLVTLGIKDSGVGISDERMHQLFTMIREVPTGDSVEHEGIGLVLSKDLVERNGGRMYVESKEGQGSTFYFSLPGKKID